MQTTEHDAPHRGRQALRPTEIPLKGWKDILLRTKDELGNDSVGLIAAGVAFYALLAVFPFIGTLITGWSLLADPMQIERQIEAAASALPQDAAQIFIDQARSVAEGAGGAASLGAIAGVLFSLWSSSKGINALMQGLNVVYDEEEHRSFVKQVLVKIGLSIGVVMGAALAVAATLILPALFGTLGLGDTGQTLASILRWPLLFALVVIGLAVVYRYAPSRDAPRWQWVSPGALLGTAAWVLGTFAFSLYVRNFGSYNETYGSIGAVIIALMWFWLSAYIILAGAELNAEMERQTRRDTTIGGHEPMGERDAVAADTVGAARP